MPTKSTNLLISKPKPPIISTEAKNIDITVNTHPCRTICLVFSRVNLESSLKGSTQAKSPRVNFTWNEFRVNFTWNFHVNFTWISREICFMWISRETVTWISRETRFTWNSCEIFHVNCRWIEFHMKFTWNMHLYFTWILWVEIYSRVSISGKKN